MRLPELHKKFSIIYTQFILREKCPYLELFWSAFSRIRTEYERYSLSLRIQFECGKMWIRITPNADTFYAVQFTVHGSLQIRFTLFPIDTGHKLNVHMTFRRRPGHLLNVLCTFNLCSVSTGFYRKVELIDVAIIFENK